MKIIPYGKQNINSKDLIKVTNTLKEAKITTGKKVLEFEKKLEKYFDCKYATTCNSGTSALYLAFLSIYLNKSDIILMPSINFISSFFNKSSLKDDLDFKSTFFFNSSRRNFFAFTILSKIFIANLSFQYRN